MTRSAEIFLGFGIGSERVVGRLSELMFPGSCFSVTRETCNCGTVHSS